MIYTNIPMTITYNSEYSVNFKNPILFLIAVLKVNSYNFNINTYCTEITIVNEISLNLK